MAEHTAETDRLERPRRTRRCRTSSRASHWTIQSGQPARSTARLAFETDPTKRLNTPDYRAAIDRYAETDVKPYVPDARVDCGKPNIGYEIPLTRHFYTYIPPRPLEEIDAEIKALEAEIQALLNEVTE